MRTRAGKSLDDFKRAHDPMFVGDSPVPVWDWDPRPGADRFIFTAAQNATPVHREWWAVLNYMAAEKNAQLVVLPIRYKNPTSQWSGSQKNDEHWVSETDGLLVNTRAQLNANLQLLADIKIQPTAADPVGAGDLAAISGEYSAIVGHPKIQTRAIATPQNKMAKLLMTSGMCTVENYSDTRAGRVAAFHHSLSAVLVELRGRQFFMRRLHFDTKTKSCTDSAAGVRYYKNSSGTAPPALALVTGDLHCDYADPKVIDATFGAGGMVEVARPQHVIYHDIVDGYAVNHHHRGDPFNKIAKYLSGRDNARQELDRTLDFLRAHTVKGTQNIIAAANHSDDFLTRWVMENDWRQDPVNSEFYLETALAMRRHTRHDPTLGARFPSPFKYWVDAAKLPQTRVLDRDESFILGGVELGMHGDLGPNGARGSIRNLRRIGVKSIIGHAHSPGEDEGVTQVGTSTYLRLEYNHGPSSWLNAHAFLGEDGKRQLVTIINGKFKL